MLLGTSIDNLVVAGPAYNSRQLHRGDVIAKVDGVPVTQDSIHDALVGCDLPGSPVVISVARGNAMVDSARPRAARARCDTPVCRQGPVVEVRMTRMATADIHDRMRLYELFTNMKVFCGMNIFESYGHQ